MGTVIRVARKEEADDRQGKGAPAGENAGRMESIGGLVAKNPARVTQIRFSQAGNDTAALLWWLEIRVLTRGLDPRT